MNTTKISSTRTIQEKTLNLKRYSEKIKILSGLAKNNVTLRQQILAKARENIHNNSLNYINGEDLNSVNNTNNLNLGILSGNVNWENHPIIQSISNALPKTVRKVKKSQLLLNRIKKTLNQSSSRINNRRYLNKQPTFGGVRISSKLHKHINLIHRLNSPLSSLGGSIITPFSSSIHPLGGGENQNKNLNKIEVFKNNTIVYNFNNNIKKYNLTSILENSFFSLDRLISKPVLNIKPNKVIINLFFYLNKNIANIKVKNRLVRILKSKSLQLQILCSLLSKKLKKPVEFQLIRLHHPSLESNILANTIGYIAKNSRKTFRVIMLKLFKSTKIRKFNAFKYIYNINTFKPTALVGIRIKLGGRLLSQKIVPRFTSRTIQRGNLGKTKADLITTSRFTNKNKRGAFSFTITMGHKFF